MKHAMVKALGTAKKEDRTHDVGDLANLLLDQACILDGEIPPDPAAFARRLNDYVVRALGGNGQASRHKIFRFGVQWIGADCPCRAKRRA